MPYFWLAVALFAGFMFWVEIAPEDDLLPADRMGSYPGKWIALFAFGVTMALTS